jgi:predicted N-acetyltransferase YhbS
MTTIRTLDSEDLDFAMRQKVREGWAASREQFMIYLDLQPDGCFVATDRGLSIGMVTTVAFGASGWIGNLIVEPEHRSRGIGRALMKHGLDHLKRRGVATVHLDGDPPGIPLYRSLGFVDEYESRRYVLAGGTPSPAPSRDEFEPMRSEDLDDVAALDASAVGEDRTRFLQRKAAAAELALVYRRGGRIVASLMAASFDRGFRIGPCTALQPDDARALLAAAVSEASGRSVLIGVPGPNAAAATTLTQMGFHPTISSQRMRLGPALAAADPSRVFGIASGAVG